MIKTVSFSALEPGPKFLVLGSVHGNEKCGAYAIQRIIKEFEDGILKMQKGSVTFVPICNPRAFEADTRFIERNLNRYMLPHENPTTYEAKIGNILCPLLETCDVLLDLHSYTAGGDPFVIIDSYEPKEYAFVGCLGASVILTEWQEAHDASTKKDATPVDPDEAVGMTGYARRHGAIAALIECGQHKDPASTEAAYRAVRNALTFLGLVTADVSIKTAPAKSISVKKVYYRGDGGSFTKAWNHMEPVKKGDIIATDENNLPVTVPGDGYLIMPNATTPPGTEWFYWGQEKPPAQE